jgi:hypothetical protein
VLFDSDDRSTQAQQSQRQRCAAFGATTGEEIRAANNCRFAMLPHEELARLASSWYDASAQAMVHANYAPIINWTQRQAQLASDQGFSLHDLIEMLCICRRGAIQREKWSDDIFSVVDEAINEALVSVSREVSWTTPPNLNYCAPHQEKEKPAAARENLSESRLVPPAVIRESWVGGLSSDRRDFGRNRLRFPIWVKMAGELDEMTHTHNVSRSGVYFITRRATYIANAALRITYPYWEETGAINHEYDAKVVRLDRLGDGLVGVAVEFTESLGPSRFTDSPAHAIKTW